MRYIELPSFDPELSGGGDVLPYCKSVRAENLHVSRDIQISGWQCNCSTYLQSATLTTASSPPSAGLALGFNCLVKKALKVLYFVKSGSRSSSSDPSRLYVLTNSTMCSCYSHWNVNLCLLCCQLKCLTYAPCSESKSLPCRIDCCIKS